VIPNGVDSIQLPRRAPTLSRAKVLTAAVVSNFHDVKALPSLIGISEELTRRGVALRFEVFGGPLDSSVGTTLKGLISEHGLTAKIRLRGSTSHPDVLRELASSEFELFVSPSLQEGCSIALLEAISIGLPVVTTETGNAATCAKVSESVRTVALPFSSPLVLNPERITEWGGSVHLDNVVEFADAIEAFAKDPRLAITNAHNAVDAFREIFSVSTMAKRYSTVYGIRVGNSP
jgi:glycosyltransferase involved in cell wall biosynthesis